MVTGAWSVLRVFANRSQKDGKLYLSLAKCSQEYNRHLKVVACRCYHYFLLSSVWFVSWLFWQHVICIVVYHFLWWSYQETFYLPCVVVAGLRIGTYQFNSFPSRARIPNFIINNIVVAIGEYTVTVSSHCSSTALLKPPGVPVEIQSQTSLIVCPFCVVMILTAQLTLLGRLICLLCRWVIVFIRLKHLNPFRLRPWVEGITQSNTTAES